MLHGMEEPGHDIGRVGKTAMTARNRKGERACVAGCVETEPFRQQGAPKIQARDIAAAISNPYDARNFGQPGDRRRSEIDCGMGWLVME